MSLQPRNVPEDVPKKTWFFARMSCRRRCRTAQPGAPRPPPCARDFHRCAMRGSCCAHRPASVRQAAAHRVRVCNTRSADSHTVTRHTIPARHVRIRVDRKTRAVSARQLTSLHDRYAGLVITRNQIVAGLPEGLEMHSWCDRRSHPFVGLETESLDAAQYGTPCDTAASRANDASGSAMLIHRVEPVYPPLAKQTHREGRVECAP